MAISGPPRSVFGLFGGPGFIVALALLLGAGIFITYQTTGDRKAGSGATLSLPGNVAPGPAVPPPANQTASDPAAPLQTMPPMAAQDTATPAAAPAPMIEIDEDLSPAELLEQYPPDPALSLDAAEAAPAVPPQPRRTGAVAEAQRLALVATGLGLDRALTAQAIVAAPADVALSFGAGTEDLAGWIAAARAYGHEALVDLQLGVASGTHETDERVLLTELGPAENLRRLDAILAAAPKATGVTISITDSFLGDATALTPILERLQAAGLIIVGLPVTAPRTIAADRAFQDTLEDAGVARETLALKSLVRQRGAALVLANPENAMALARSWSQPSQDPAVELSLVRVSSLVED
ncbi:MAG TPA: divergent polysaccharide deacetylase family protein [Dongiaceae bacterium]|nr:divergent polysaccharide deacetylase family protein [Dongiaceae bacterium]